MTELLTSFTTDGNNFQETFHKTFDFSILVPPTQNFWTPRAKMLQDPLLCVLISDL